MEFDKAKMDAYKREAMHKYNLKTDEDYKKWILHANMILQFLIQCKSKSKKPIINKYYALSNHCNIYV
jgi:hypothetical protein